MSNSALEAAHASDWLGNPIPPGFPTTADIPLLPPLFPAHSDANPNTTAQWYAGRASLLDTLLHGLYGPLPRKPEVTLGIPLHRAVARQFFDAHLHTLRVEADGASAFVMQVFVPKDCPPVAVILNGDGCWHYATDAVIAATLARGYAFATFNRTEIRSDMPTAGDSQGVVAQVSCPALANQTTGALAAWAWGYHRAVDVLQRLEGIDAARIAAVGHSRGGKASLLAGATDTRIALTSANNSGAAGAGSFIWPGPQSETLADLQRQFQDWLAPQHAHNATKEHRFDMHFLKALIAPRALLTTEALDDHWANPSGTWLTHLAAHEVYALLGVPERIGIAYRPGGHSHDLQDWTTLLDFADTVLG